MTEYKNNLYDNLKKIAEQNAYSSDSQPGCMVHPRVHDFFQRVHGNNGVHGGVHDKASVYKNAHYEKVF